MHMSVRLSACPFVSVYTVTLRQMVACYELPRTSDFASQRGTSFCTPGCVRVLHDTRTCVHSNIRTYVHDDDTTHDDTTTRRHDDTRRRYDGGTTTARRRHDDTRHTTTARRHTTIMAHHRKGNNRSCETYYVLLYIRANGTGKKRRDFAFTSLPSAKALQIDHF